eukprot:gene31345-6500_t
MGLKSQALGKEVAVFYVDNPFHTHKLLQACFPTLAKASSLAQQQHRMSRSAGCERTNDDLRETLVEIEDSRWDRNRLARINGWGSPIRTWA